MPFDLMKLLEGGESSTLELKAKIDAQSIGNAVCAFLNSEGGRIVIGVDDQLNVIGVDDKEDVDALHDFLERHLSPSAAWALSEFNINEKRILLLDVPQGPVKPYLCKGRILFRRGDAYVAASAEEVHELIEQRSRIDDAWERHSAFNHSVDDIDEKELREFASDSVDAGRLSSSVSSNSVDKILNHLGLLVDGRPVQAAIVGFGKNLLPWYPQCTLRVARFDGTTKDTIAEQDKVTGHAFAIFDRASKFIREHTPIASAFEEGDMFRKDKPLYPVLAVREAVINAICHRDYSISGGAVSIAIFDDRMEIVSTGGLPDDLTVALLKGSHYSRPRNPLIADLFYRRGLIDLWGRGIHKIIRLCMDAGGREPEIAVHAGEFGVTFFAPRFDSPELANFDLSDRQTKIVSSLATGAKRRFQELKKEVDPSVSGSTFRNDLVALRELGLVESGGFGRGAFWRLARLEGE